MKSSNLNQLLSMRFTRGMHNSTSEPLTTKPVHHSTIRNLVIEAQEYQRTEYLYWSVLTTKIAKLCGKSLNNITKTA